VYCPAVCYLFDCLYLDGRPIMTEPLTRRREWLQDSIRKGNSYRLSEAVEDGPAFFEAVKQLGLEGVMAKQRSSPYLPGKRSESWLKIKVQQTVECVIIGYTRGTGDREATFGALHLAQINGGELKYIGKVGTGFDDRVLKLLDGEIKKLTRVKKPVKQKLLDDSQSTWVESKIMCEVQFASMTKDGMMREPIFIRLRPDLTP
jgi:bifunctional non-homologous end joining protein LigD